MPPSSIDLLDNIFWHSLAGQQLPFSSGDARARRYAPGFSPIAAFPDADAPDFDALATLFAPGEQFYCSGRAGAMPTGWRVLAEAPIFLMLYTGAAPAHDPAADAVRLGPEHVEQMVALAQLTRPGPFGPRTPELGDYFGYFDGARLVAMAGERLAAPGLREISGVCTHPDAQGRGYARRLMDKLILREMARAEQPFLHVMGGNERARALYNKMGFVDHRESVVRIVERQ